MGLPTQLTTFVGRARETGALEDLLAGARLVTIAGPGGCGKTRLAIHVGDRHDGTVVFADLSTIDGPAAVGRVVAESVGARAPSPAAIAEAVTGAPSLLIIDNCEHVVDASAALVDAVLRAAPTVTILATSREPLGVDGEVTYRVPSLEPADAAALFVERAGRARPGRGVPAPDAVEDICERLDGIPLAIELAAARMRVLSADQIRDGLHDRFRLLTGGARTAVQRQQTLQASVDWSHELLQENERIVLRRLSVFVGGFTLDAAEAISAVAPIKPHHVLDLVSQLVEKSLVTATGDDRLALLETVRQYAGSKLVDADEADDARRRHYDFVLASAWRRREAGESDAEHRARIRADIDNARRALQWAVDHPDAGPIVELTGRLYPYWVQGSDLREGADWTAHAVERTVDAPAVVRAPILRRYSQLRALSGDWSVAMPAAMSAIDAAREVGDHRNLVLALVQATSIARNLPIGDAPELLDEAIAIGREVGFDGGLAFALYMKAFGSWQRDGDVAAGTAMATEALDLARATAYADVERLSEALLAKLRFVRGEVTTAILPLEAAAGRLRDVGEAFIFGQVVSVLAHLKALAGDDEGADVLIAELEDMAAESTSQTEQFLARTARSWTALVRDHDLPASSPEKLFEWVARLAPHQRVGGLGYPAIAFARAGDLRTATPLADEVLRLGLHTGAMPAPSLPAAFVAFAAGDLGAAEQHLCHAIERMITTGGSAAWARLQSALTLAAIASKQEQHDEAARIFGSVHTQAATLGVSTETDSWRWCEDGQLDATRAAVGEELFAQLWDQGATLDWEELAAYVLRGRGARKRPTWGWDSLTPTELLVVELVAEGLGNRQIADKLFISVPTVKSHLTHVYTKLSMRSRAEVGTAYVRRAASTTSPQ